MSTLREAAQQALEVLEQDNPAGRSATISALRAALAQPEPRNQCGETCERAKLCAVCARGLEEQEQEQEPVAKMHVVFEDNNGALRRTPADCQAFGANGQPAAVYVGRQRYVPEQGRADPAQAPCDIAEDGVCEVIDCCRKLPQQEQEPVAWMVYTEDGKSAYVTDNPHDLVGAYKAFALYTHPPRREWQNLTMQEINALPEIGGVMWRMGTAPAVLRAIRAVEAKLKEKNA